VYNNDSERAKAEVSFIITAELCKRSRSCNIYQFSGSEEKQ